jgi:hypothetical protein
MSNPAVITLANTDCKNDKFERFVVEDNIGESIHLHIDNMRVDFTIKEFLEFSCAIRKTLNQLDLLQGYKTEHFDEHFLKECSTFLPDLKSIKIEEIKISNLTCIVHCNYKSDLNLLKLVTVSNTPAYKFLQGDKKEFLEYEQFNYFGIDNEKRLLETLDSIKENKYPYNDNYIVLFNGQDIIRDGQHRVAILAHLYGLDATIKIIRFNFNGSNHILYNNIDNIKICIKWFARKVLKKIRLFIKICFVKLNF